MNFEQKPDSGSLFRNDRREKDSHPHATGSAVIDGVDYWVSAWTNTDRNGNKYQSLKFKRKEQAATSRQSYAAASGRAEPVPVASAELDDEIPF